jgi:thiol-disulfide isomerase/thioredoxin
MEELKMGVVKIFYKDDCPKCPLAKRLRDNLKEQKVSVLDYNVGTADGLAEASFYSIMSLPTVLVEDGMENGVGEWRGDVPGMEEVLNAIHSA